MIYLDNHATTRCAPEVIEAMSEELSYYVGNPSSSHYIGELASGRIQRATRPIAEIINGDDEGIVLTSGATESNNLAILGLSRSDHLASRRTIITTKIEHKSVTEPILHLKKMGWEIKYFPLNSDGTILLEEARNLIDNETALISIQLANSEIGTIQPVESIVAIAKSVGALIHCDAAQAVGKINVDVQRLGVDLLSFCGHKLYGPQGIGALWVRAGIKKILSPLFFGGGTIYVRPGTIPISLVVGFGRACELAIQSFDQHFNHLQSLRNQFEGFLQSAIPEIIINGSSNRLPNNSNITFPDVDAEALLAQMPEVVASTGAACESGSVEPSRVLTAIGIAREAAFNTIRFGFGKFNTAEETKIAAERIQDAFKNVTALSD